MEYIEICEWDKFQHYKKRNPPWIKLYSSVLDDDDFDCMPDASKLLFFCLLPFASRRNNKVKYDLVWLQKKLPIEKKLTQKTLQPLINAGFIECYQDASNGIAVCKQDATPETEKRQSKEKTEKNKHMDFVLLSQDEHGKLVEQFTAKGADSRIGALNDYLGSTGKKYKSHYHTILTWERRSGGVTKAKNKIKLFPISGKICSRRECKLPAVYKSSGGEYDTFYCQKHMPDQVKEMYG